MSLYSGRYFQAADRKVFFGIGAMGKTPLRCPILLFSLLVAIFSVSAHSDTAEKNTPLQRDSCARFENTQPLCLFTNPEDLAVLADNKMLIVSEFGDSYGTRPGALVFYDIEKQQRRLAFAGGDAIKPEEHWGSSACNEPPGSSFSPHGIDLTQRSDGRWQLLVVQHGGRESIEFFEVRGSGNKLQLVWRGCALAPEKAMLNSVAAGAGDEFFTTKINSTDQSWESGELVANEPTGVVYRWSKASGFRPVLGTEGVMLNGITATTDGRIIYVVYSGENRFKKIDTDTGAVLASTDLQSADNVKWSADGKTLLAASFTGSASNEEFIRCMLPGVELCPIAFAIIEFDPETLSKETLFENPDAPMGAGTVGMKVGSQLFIGSFTGNRLLQVSLEKPDRKTMR